MPQSRLTIVRRGLLLGSVGLTGYMTVQESGTPSTTDEGTPIPPENEMPTEISFWLEEVSLSESEQDAIDPIVFSELSSGQKEIVQTALEEDEYTTEMGEELPELAGLRRIIEAKAVSGEGVYLKRNGIYYRIGFASGDHIIANPGY